MKILAIGDSITLGKPGISYVQYLPECDVDNYGKAGDTIIGIFNRLKEVKLNEYEIVIMEGGGNDILLKIFYEERPLWRKVIDNIINSGSIPTNDVYEYISTWQDILRYLAKYPRIKTIVISNPVLGEDVNNSYNKIVLDYNNQLNKLCQKHTIKYIDFFSWQSKKVSGNPKLMTNTPVDVERDAMFTNIDELDNLAKQRNYNLTIDGVHFNSLSAKALAEFIRDVISA